MKNLSDLMGNVSPSALVFTAKDGRQHTMRYFDIDCGVEYENWLKSNAIENIRSRKALYGEDYLAVLAECNKAIDSGDYAFGGQIATKSIPTKEGTITMCAIVLGVDRIRAKWLIDQHGEELVLLINKQLERSIPPKQENGGIEENPTPGAGDQQTLPPTTTK